MRKLGNQKEEDEVNRLLEAAQDGLLLELSSDATGNPYTLPDSLDRRFQSLKCKSTPPSQSHPSSRSKSSGAEEYGDVLKRFAALKTKTSPPSGSAIELEEDRKDEDEVEKIIKWAQDAARLDPSPPSDDEEEEEGDIDWRRSKSQVTG